MPRPWKPCARRSEVQTSAVEIDSGLEVVDVPKAISHLFDTLDFRIDTFTDSVGDAMATVGEDVFDMAFDHRRHFFDGLQSAMSCPEMPSLPETPGSRRVKVMP